MPGKTAKITITERQQEILQTISRSARHPRSSGNAPRSSSWPSTAFAMTRSPTGRPVAAPGQTLATTLGRRLGSTHPHRVHRDPRRLATGHRAVLRDEPRPGAPGKFTPEQVIQILAVACEPPEKSGRPITHWTAHELADEVDQAGHRGVDLAVTQVGRYLREAALQPHKSRYWLNTTEKDPAVFAGAGRGGL